MPFTVIKCSTLSELVLKLTGKESFKPDFVTSQSLFFGGGFGGFQVLGVD